MDFTLKFSILLLLLGFASVSVNASPFTNDFGHCERVVKKWASSSLEQEVKEDKHRLRDLLFFLHVPRTGGRTYFHCFLRKLYYSSLECPRSYDKLRFDPRKRHCRLLVTHDDYSMMSKLPRERTSVVTILRDPVDRVFSTYEFSVEVAARFLVHPNLTSATQMARRIRSKTKGVSTLDIWPWKYLVPWMREDLFSRRDGQEHRGSDDVQSNDPYNMEEVVMPLHEYINDPIAQEIVHNGETFQVAGLTNNSYLSESHEVRHCVQRYKHLGEHVLEVAKKRLDDMLYVGLTEEHRESATMFANVVGAQVISQLGGSNSSEESATESKPEQSYSVSDSKSDNNDLRNRTLDGKESEIASPETVEAVKGNMTVGELMKAYEDCISSLRKTQANRRTSSLKRISPANFTKQARLQVPEMVLQQIRELNHLDVELYKYAQNIFANQHKRNFGITGIWERMQNSTYGTSMKVLSLGGTLVLLLLAFYVFVNARRRTSKVKI
ncbi:protein-tyrosine sulfotransferase isoform X1 [Pyrus x bretschneideri]|uniref:protein-tyrosine sulfotransferase isoform X1 n=1 Tax=Pyrus x bretschneideri TaxID=225117 RepID=UPI0020301C50|nr:protein-tyrosine sulfotransferase isoform X1 [Pyrus x bretschneideri]XP_048444907.1 protein-tyrosine sulfotransferase isoform X1 [Pyrus x bretschneideri]XP_048444908.1 protein-tyrosine sulfotransferase isoform X1 [Pyrus x bretschneideri]XP_048444909.1 protein-tyrosine sulfotransferase isoform X1 [Pyrus x bretschneideri]XP_048444910.1 protein-tyrosine sulfotransferase isoform X1 [Pyrus x bretschneideri]XP_048444911.1 protein-tyrosine sulfotransferase isoform X1 [Pyrus x bretschneideri]XP_04